MKHYAIDPSICAAGAIAVYGQGPYTIQIVDKDPSWVYIADKDGMNSVGWATEANRAIFSPPQAGFILQMINN